MKYKIQDGVYVHFLLEKDLKNELQKEAKEKGLSLNSYIRMILIERGK